MKLILSIFIFLSIAIVMTINCLSSEFKNIDNRNTLNKIVQNAIEINNIGFETNNLVYNPKIGFTIYDKIPAYKFELKPKNESIIYSSTIDFDNTNIILISLPEGKYFAKFTFEDTKVYPMIATIYSQLNIFFGYFNYGNKQYKVPEDEECFLVKPNFLEVVNNIVCPMLNINENNIIKINIEQGNTNFSGNATAAPWILGLFFSIKSVDPTGIIFPIVFGPVGFEKQIKGPFKNLKVKSLD